MALFRSTQSAIKVQSYKRSQKRLVQKRTAEYEVKSLKDEAEEMIEEMVLRIVRLIN